MENSLNRNCFNKGARFLLSIFVLFFISNFSFAQQHPLYSQYMFNRLAINPAYAGSKDALMATMLLRSQWVGIDGAPNTQTFTLQSPVAKKKVGVGFSVFADQIGPRKMTGLAGSYAYRITLPKGKLAMGARFGFYQYVYNWDMIDHLDNGDAVYNQGQTRFYVPSADAGLYYHNNNFYGGFSATQLMNGRITAAQTANGDKAHLVPHLFAMAGYGFAVNDNVVLNPGLTLRTAKGVPVNADVNLNVQLQKKVWIGLSYRTSYGIVALTQVAVTDKFNVGYSFDYGFDPITRNTRGSHEIILEYNFSSIGKSKVLSPRFFYF